MQHISFTDCESSDMIQFPVVIHPTNSCYGFGARIDDEAAYKKIYDLKGRSREKPFFITISSWDKLA